MADPGKLSASKITCYKGCPLAYYLKYVEHVKVPTHVRLVFGKAIHYMLERFYKVNYKSAESFSKYWKYYWFGTTAGDFLKGKQKKELEITEIPVKKDFILRIGNHISLGPNAKGAFFGYMKLGENILRTFYKRHKDEKNENVKNRKPPIAIEKSFGVKKDEPIEIGGHLVRGVLDRVDELNKGLCFTDYKSDKVSPAFDSFNLHRHPQFTLYSYAFRKIYETIEKVILYYHLRSGKVFKTYRSEKDFDYLKKLLDDVIEGIENDRFTPFYSYHCKFCDLKVGCEDYSISHHGGPRIDLEGRIKPAKEFKLWDAEVPDWMEMQTIE